MAVAGRRQDSDGADPDPARHGGRGVAEVVGQPPRARGERGLAARERGAGQAVGGQRARPARARSRRSPGPAGRPSPQRLRRGARAACGESLGARGGGVAAALPPAAARPMATGMTSSVSSAARGCGRWSMATPFRVGLRARGDGCDQPVPRGPVPPQGEEQRRQAARKRAARSDREPYGGGQRDDVGARVSPDPRRDEPMRGMARSSRRGQARRPASSRRAATRRRWSTRCVSCATVQAVSRPATAPARRVAAALVARGAGAEGPSPVA